MEIKLNVFLTLTTEESGQLHAPFAFTPEYKALVYNEKEN
jgi:hypothetical protein